MDASEIQMPGVMRARASLNSAQVYLGVEVADLNRTLK